MDPKRTTNKRPRLVGGDDDDPEYNPEVDLKQINSNIWSEKQELSFVSGMLKFSTEKGLDPNKSMNMFFMFLKESRIANDFTEQQIKLKLKSLRRKYGKLITGKGKSISRIPHEERICKMLKNIWGGGGGGEPSFDASTLFFGDEDYGWSNDGIDWDERFTEFGDDMVEKGMRQLGEETRVEFKNQWEEFHIMELQLYAKRAKFIQLRSEMILDANTKSSQNN